jgi:hypothetical protein
MQTTSLLYLGIGYLGAAIGAGLTIIGAAYGIVHLAAAAHPCTPWSIAVCSGDV